MARKTEAPEFSAEELEWLKIPIDPELSGSGTEVRILPDGRLLFKWTALSYLQYWPSREAFVAFRKESEAAVAKGPIDMTLTLLPPIDDFLRDVEAHARALGPRLRIADATLDGTVASLEAVDKALRKIPRANREVADLVTPLVAYVGEVYCKATGGKWMKPMPTYKYRKPIYDPAAVKRGRRFIPIPGEEEPKPIRYDVVEKPYRGSMNEPFVVASNEHSFQPFSDVFLPMAEPSKRGPLRESVTVQLTMAGFPNAP
jgi:hypothetical protein